jgi:hypothetical protein
MPNQKLWKFLIEPTSAHAQMSEERRDHASAIVPKPTPRNCRRQKRESQRRRFYATLACFRQLQHLSRKKKENQK